MTCSHAYFVKVLEQIHEQLKITCVDSGRALKMQEERQLESHVNKYDTLANDLIDSGDNDTDVEEPSAAVQADLAASTLPWYEPDIDPAEEDHFKCMCAYEDSVQISDHIVGRWAAYVR
jgi:hypothetical protein